MRTTLPPRRHNRTGRLDWRGQPYTLTCGYGRDGGIAEIFLDAPRIGSDVAALVRDAAILASFALQYGAPLDRLVAAMMKDGEDRPASVIGLALALALAESTAPVTIS